MDAQTENPPAGGAGGFDKTAFPGRNCNQTITPTANVAQAKIDLLFDDIGPNLYAMGAMLNAAAAMHEAGDPAGLLYALRRMRAYWRPITGSAAELVAADAERLSALRHGAVQ
jgi:hypothetical protein